WASVESRCRANAASNSWSRRLTASAGSAAWLAAGFAAACAAALELSAICAPIGSATASAEPSTRVPIPKFASESSVNLCELRVRGTRRGSVRLDRRGIIGCKVEAALGKASKTEKAGRLTTGNRQGRHAAVTIHFLRFTTAPLALSAAMVGMAGENRRGAIKLLK